MDNELEITKVEVKIAWTEKQIAAKTQRVAAVEAHKVKIDNAHIARVLKMNDEISTLQDLKSDLEAQKSDLEALIVP